ncbi:MAG: aminotransferase class I/II-fold pyridoxal phosphate-dependent enzyme [Candidatus Marinimicrobia bacterium]|jgi:aspartate/methionine/tyrosine aminotransferase|nr:aminotransferase class I/II-fold pyridoxal phosphate-dependent enzyme [Candidatus Neomarinimicrobiota bacterium]MBT4555689.1 aminotransferase class I/II-fold pyridoxal phosphate-dependent enzyme [Candidatus Neomarinimicrobiota bacterium]MBT5114744.1 aminotransferase class I/II-fold pyridoxal phosphate-dependent enzyme [Candidatus Neomarinimicrobiota bacterium]MBT5748694.1 aminotransferase class I/II-fold pyridoxal phosphate-dependent enzyme [Candidatus Neomarinimicrobiota bacterium]MBT641308|tara:strand:+ start:31701 stop:32897 length:1197 start_codon:yes stop_codon:yes gene_type:complete
MKFNTKLNRLGTETAFAVSAQARVWAEKGHKIYPFHLGDINLPTPKNIREATHKFMNQNKNGYCPSEGIPELREALAHDVGSKRGVEYGINNVVVQPGGKPTIWKFFAVIMNEGDEVLYPNPGYPIYESQIKYQGGIPIPYSYDETETGFAIDIEKLRASITDKTTALVYNNYQNPISAASSQDEMEALADLAIEHDLWVLSDDAYYEIRYTDEPPRSIVNIPGMKERTVILYTFSKKFAMTGWRVGASIGPSEVINQIARFNINDESCTNHFIQHALAETVGGDSSGANELSSELQARRDETIKGLNAIDGIHVPTPESTFYSYPNVSTVMANKGFTDLDKFRTSALEATGVSFCARHHFGTPLADETDHYIRLAYSGINQNDIREGLAKLKSWIEG